MDSGDWSIVFYREESGRSPVREFLDSLDETTQESLLVAVEMLRVRNVQAREPLVRHLEGKLWELRRESRTNIYRVIYFFFIGRRIVLLHAFQKKTQKTPRREIETALARYNRIVQKEKEVTSTDE
jgi:phage-related protein